MNKQQYDYLFKYPLSVNEGRLFSLIYIEDLLKIGDDTVVVQLLFILSTTVNISKIAGQKE